MKMYTFVVKWTLKANDNFVLGWSDGNFTSKLMRQKPKHTRKNRFTRERPTTCMVGTPEQQEIVRDMIDPQCSKNQKESMNIRVPP